MNQRTDNERLLEDVLADETGGDVREASLENILRLARRRRRTRHMKRAGAVLALLLVATMGALRYFPPQPAKPEVAQAPLALPGFARITSQPLAPNQIVAALQRPNIVHTVPENFRVVGDEELLALAAPQIVALVRRGPHEAELVFVSPQSNSQEN
jgi:hypothetical protein